MNHSFLKAQTKYEYKTVDVVKKNGTKLFKEKTLQLVKKYVGAADSSNILGKQIHTITTRTAWEFNLSFNYTNIHAISPMIYIFFIYNGYF